MERTLLPADWCCSMDADVPKLLSVAERRDYSRKSLQAAVAKGSGLLPCPVPDCPGIAAMGALISLIVVIFYNITRIQS